MTGEFNEMFREELLGLVGSLEAELLELESSPGRERLDASFRHAHNIKSAAAMLGLPRVARVAHAMEGVLEGIRAGRLEPGAEVVSRLLSGLDQLRLLSHGDGGAEDEDALCRRLDALHAQPAAPPAEPSLRTVRAELRLDPEVLQRALDPLRLLMALSQLGEVVTANVDLGALPTLESLEPTRLHLGFELELRTAAPLEDLRAVLFFAEGSGTAKVAEVDAPGAPEVPQAIEAPGPRASVETLIVGTRRIDAIVDLAAELLVATSRLDHLRQDREAGAESRMEAATREVRRLASRVQEAAMAIRLVPLAPSFLAIRRHLRELAAQQGKELEVELRGAQVEVDKSVSERLLDPLKHLVRNALIHGIESPAERRAAGKPAAGKLVLEAREEQGQLRLLLEDDGRGIDAEKVRAAAVARGLLRPEQLLSHAEALELIFQAGFSTTADADELSGRGVGLDVVRRNLGALGGDVAVSSTPGAGTRFTLSLPLTLAVLEGLVIRSDTERLVIPLEPVQRLVRLAPRQVARLPDGRPVLQLDGEPLPVLSPATAFGFGEGGEHERLAVVVSLGERGRVALLVDEVLGQEPVLLKPLQRGLRYREGLLGAAVLGDGRVALVLDVGHLAADVTLGPQAPPTSPSPSVSASPDQGGPL